MSKLEIERVSTLTRELEGQVLQIYLTSFPSSERIEFSEFLQGIYGGEKLFFIAKKAEDAIGFALVAPLSCAGIYLLEYMAIDANIRSQGYGSQLLHHVADNLLHQENAKGILLEVEHPNRGSDKERLDSKRRIQFYLRNEVRMLDEVTSYCMPDLSGDGIVELKLMWLPLDKTCLMNSDQKLKDCITSIYTDIYERSNDDPILQSILRSLAF